MGMKHFVCMNKFNMLVCCQYSPLSLHITPKQKLEKQFTQQFTPGLEFTVPTDNKRWLRFTYQTKLQQPKLIFSLNHKSSAVHDCQCILQIEFKSLSYNITQSHISHNHCPNYAPTCHSMYIKWYEKDWLTMPLDGDGAPKFNA